MGCGRARRRCIDLSMGGGGITSVMTFFWLFKKGHCTSMGLNLIPIYNYIYNAAGSPSNLDHGDSNFCGFAEIPAGRGRRKPAPPREPRPNASFGDLGWGPPPTCGGESHH